MFIWWKVLQLVRGMLLPPRHSVGRELKGILFIIKWCLLNYICTGLWIFQTAFIFHNPCCPAKHLCEVVQAGIFLRGERERRNTKVGLLKVVYSTIPLPWRSYEKRKIKCSHSEHSRATSLIPWFQIMALVSYFYRHSPRHITLPLWHTHLKQCPNPQNLATQHLTKVDHRHKYKMQNYATYRRKCRRKIYVILGLEMSF